MGGEATEAGPAAHSDAPGPATAADMGALVAAMREHTEALRAYTAITQALLSALIASEEPDEGEDGPKAAPAVDWQGNPLDPAMRYEKTLDGYIPVGPKA